jgi:hypothetical protein
MAQKTGIVAAGRTVVYGATAADGTVTQVTAGPGQSITLDVDEYSRLERLGVVATSWTPEPPSINTPANRGRR